ncbi:thiamine pyrophosphate-dependent enzyme [Chloroflexota bacterium]
MEKTIPVDEVVEAFVELLNANNVEYIFLNPGTDTFPIQESLSKAEQQPISPEWLGYCVSEVIDEDTIHVHEMARITQRSKQGTLFGSGGSSLGFGMGGALGIKLASPDKTVVSMMGDGCFVFGCPIPTFWTANVSLKG